jgi:hypothetical protein
MFSDHDRQYPSMDSVSAGRQGAEYRYDYLAISEAQASPVQTCTQLSLMAVKEKREGEGWGGGRRKNVQDLNLVKLE